jgi:hypothetical protein
MCCGGATVADRKTEEISCARVCAEDRLSPDAIGVGTPYAQLHQREFRVNDPTPDFVSPQCEDDRRYSSGDGSNRRQPFCCEELTESYRTAPGHAEILTVRPAFARHADRNFFLPTSP